MPDLRYGEMVTIHRKPIFKNGVTYIRYLKRYYKVTDFERLFPEIECKYPLYCFYIDTTESYKKICSHHNITERR